METTKNYADALSELLEEINNVAVTENGAIAYKTANSPLIDIHYKVGTLRNEDQINIIKMFAEVYNTDRDIALKWLFYVRDIREGLGERRVFNVIWKWLAETHPFEVMHLIGKIPEYGRWDDLLVLEGTGLQDVAVLTIAKQLKKDIATVGEYIASGEEKPISLLGKWLPSINSHDIERRRSAKFLSERLGLWYADYRRICSNLREYLDVVERKMSENRWGEINYPTVPSKAMLTYFNAFDKHDTNRYRAYLTDLAEGKTKINASVTNPHEIVKKYREEILLNDLTFRDADRHVNPTLEEMWKALPDTIGNSKANILMMRDGSLSMVRNNVAGSKTITALDVSTALAVYFAERNHGIFHNKFITFSAEPMMVDLEPCETLFDKLKICYMSQDPSNTNIQHAFQMLLLAAVQWNIPQEDFPEAIVIVSDMEFDAAVKDSNTINKHLSRFELGDQQIGFNPKLFDVLSIVYAQHGYKLPKLIFWNVCNRSNTIPMKENDLGCILMSGFSTNAMSMVMSKALSPYDAIMNELSKERYADIKAETNPVPLDAFIHTEFPIENPGRAKEVFDAFLKTHGLQIIKK